MYEQHHDLCIRHTNVSSLHTKTEHDHMDIRQLSFETHDEMDQTFKTNANVPSKRSEIPTTRARRGFLNYINELTNREAPRVRASATSSVNNDLQVLSLES